MVKTPVIETDLLKNIRPSLLSIKNFELENAFNLVAEDSVLHQTPSIVSYDDRGFNIKIFMEDLQILSEWNNSNSPLNSEVLHFSRGKKKFRALAVENRSKLQLSSPGIINLRTNHFQSLTNDHQCYRQTIIRAREKPNFHSFDGLSLNHNGKYSKDAMRISISGSTYLLYLVSEIGGERCLIVIESEQKTGAQQYNKVYNSILLALGLISGNLYWGEHYNLTSDDNAFVRINSIEFRNLAKESISNLYLIKSAAYKSSLDEEDSKSKKIYISVNEFSKICQDILDKENMNRSVLLLLEVNSSNFNVLRCAIYSIGIETMINLIYKEKKTATKPIHDSKLSRNLVFDLLKSLDQYTNDLDQNTMAVLKARINNINSPTNLDRTIAAFEMLDLPLVADDLTCLKSRNKFLHGATPFKARTTEDEIEVKFTTMRLHYLLSALILKYTGYSGHIYKRAIVNMDEGVFCEI